jgi:hypothetical protein
MNKPIPRFTRILATQKKKIVQNSRKWDFFHNSHLALTPVVETT